MPRRRPGPASEQVASMPRNPAGGAGTARFVIPSNATLRRQPNQPWSVAAWVWGRSAIFATATAPDIWPTGFVVRDDYALIRNSGGSVQVSVTDGALYGTWKHIVWTWDGSLAAAGLHMYLNGYAQGLSVVADTGPSATDGGAGDCHIGGHWTCSSTTTS
jgi:hypothetical protein